MPPAASPPPPSTAAAELSLAACAVDIPAADLDEPDRAKTGGAAGALAADLLLPALLPPLSDGDMDAEGGGRCRVCLGGCEDGPLSRLQCLCRGELALVHEACATRWFRRKGTGVCELCCQHAFDLPPTLQQPALRPLSADNFHERRAERAASRLPGARKVVLLGIISVTLGFILAGALGWIVPALHCRRLNLPLGLLPMMALVFGLRVPIHDRIPVSVSGSWQAIYLLLGVAFLVCVSVLMTTDASAWC